MLQSPNGIGRCDDDDKIAAMSTQVGPTGAEILVNSLAAEGVDTIFGLPGLQLDYIFDALYDRQDAIRVIHTRHEQATAYMAFGYAQAKRPRWHVPCGARTGRSQRDGGAVDRLRVQRAGALHHRTNSIRPHRRRPRFPATETPDQTGLLASVSKWQGLVKSPADAPRTSCRRLFAS